MQTIAALVIMIGTEKFSRQPYTMNNAAPIEFTVLRVIMFFIRNETSTTAEAA
jgi:hypothetical protein